MSSSPQSSDDSVEELNITVAVRCRGRNEREIRAKSSVVVSVPDITGSNEVSINTTDDVGITAQMNSKTYTVDKVFGPSASQSLVFHDIAEPLFADFIKGYNCTVLVYGMTSTGKTYTMTGDEKLYNGELSESAGIIPRILFRLFETLEAQREDFIVKCSFVELYNEELKDLLSVSHDASISKRLKIYDSDSVLFTGNNRNGNNTRNSSSRATSEVPPTTFQKNNKRLPNINTPKTARIYNGNKIRSPHQSQTAVQDQSTGIYIQNLQDFHINNAKEGIKLLQRGLKYRQVASTKMNDFSSRSHTIFTINLYREHEGEMFRFSKMNLVDLAGSENISRSGAQHQRAKEAGSINQSLLTLGRVINSLADKNAHVPFRESKLTRLLQDSLGGNTKTALIATISPARVNCEETCSTLQYAAKAKNIKNKPQLGSIVIKDVLVKSITSELAKIKSDLLSTKSRDGIYMSPDNYKELTNDLESYKNEVQECKRIIESLTSQNTLLLRDKKASNEVNDLQRIKIKSMTDSLNKLFEKAEGQRKREQELLDATAALRTAIGTMQSTIKQYEKREMLLKTKVRNSLSEEFSKLKNMFIGNLKEMNEFGDYREIDMQEHIDCVKSEIVTLIKGVQGKAESMYRDCVEELLQDQPNIHDITINKIDEVDNMLSDYHCKLSENLSDVSEEYNNLKHYLTDHFFKNDHEDVLKSHIDKTYNQIRTSSDMLLWKFQEMMNEHLETNRHLMINNLKAATSEVIEKEMKLFEPQKKKWEKSFDYINKCDSINNVFQKDMKSTFSEIRSAVSGSKNTINKTIQNVMVQINDYEEASNLTYNNRVLNGHIDEILSRDQILKQKVEISKSSTENYLEIVDGLKDSIMSTIHNKDQSPDKVTYRALDGSKVAGMRGYEASPTVENRPLKLASLQPIVNNGGLSVPRIRSSSQSPQKCTSVKNLYALKRSCSEFDGKYEENQNKLTRHH